MINLTPVIWRQVGSLCCTTRGYTYVSTFVCRGRPAGEVFQLQEGVVAMCTQSASAGAFVLAESYDDDLDSRSEEHVLNSVGDNAHPCSRIPTRRRTSPCGTSNQSDSSSTFMRTRARIVVELLDNGDRLLGNPSPRQYLPQPLSVESYVGPLEVDEAKRSTRLV